METFLNSIGFYLLMGGAALFAVLIVIGIVIIKANGDLFKKDSRHEINNL